MGRSPRRKTAGDAPPLLKVADVQRRLGVSRSAVFSLIARGELPRIKVGGATRFAGEDVEAMICRGRGR